MSLSKKFLRHSISWKRSAVKDLATIPALQAKNIEEKVEKIIEGDPTLDIKKLQGRFDMPTYRLRVGDYRIIFEDYEHVLVILIVAIKHRKDAY